MQRDLDTGSHIPSELDTFRRSDDVMEGGADVVDHLRRHRVTWSSSKRDLLVLLERDQCVADDQRDRFRARDTG